MPKKNLDSRPVNLDLFSLKFPITAIVSILHRISGFGLFIFIPAMLWGLKLSLQSEASFNQLSSNLSNIYIKFMIWLFVSALIYHIFAGLRHILMDSHIGDSKKAGRMGAYSVLVLSVITAIIFGVYLW